jgi:Flp pilus assembly protein TadG
MQRKHESWGHMRMKNREQGQTLVEFALSITITLMLIFGVIDFGRAVFTASVVQWAAQQGARAATVNPDQVQDAVLSRLVALDVNEVSITLSGPDAENVVTVIVDYRFEFITPFIPGGVDMQGEASMLVR